MQLPGSDGRRPPSFLIRTLLVLSRTLISFLSSLLQLPKVRGTHTPQRLPLHGSRAASSLCWPHWWPSQAASRFAVAGSHN